MNLDNWMLHDKGSSKNVFEKIKSEMKLTVKFKCECGSITDLLDLILSEGRCPNCKTQLCKMNNRRLA